MNLSREQVALKVAFGQLVRAVGGQEAAVAFTPLSRHQSLSDYANPAVDRHAPIHVVAALEAVAVDTPGHPVVTRQMARLHGFELAPMPAARPDRDDLARHLVRVVRESADVTCALSEHLQRCSRSLDGQPLCQDVAGLRQEIAEAIRALVELDAALEGEASDGRELSPRGSCASQARQP